MPRRPKLGETFGQKPVGGVGGSGGGEIPALYSGSSPVTLGASSGDVSHQLLPALSQPTLLYLLLWAKS